MFINLPLILSIDLSDLKFHTHDKENSFETMPVKKIAFKKEYVHTGILTKKAQFLKTDKPKEYLQQFDTDKIRIMHQTKVSKKSITNLQSRGSHEVTTEQIREILDDETFSNFLDSLAVKYDQTVTGEMVADWASNTASQQLNQTTIGKYLAKCVQTFQEYNDKINLINDKKNQVNEPARKAIRIIQETSKPKELEKLTPQTVRIAIKCIILTSSKQHKTSSVYVLDICDNLFITRDPYLCTCLRNETNCTQYADKTK